jgi:hypothetical protein
MFFELTNVQILIKYHEFEKKIISAISWWEQATF